MKSFTYSEVRERIGDIIGSRTRELEELRDPILQELHRMNVSTEGTLIFIDVDKIEVGPTKVGNLVFEGVGTQVKFEDPDAMQVPIIDIEVEA